MFVGLLLEDIVCVVVTPTEMCEQGRPSVQRKKGDATEELILIDMRQFMPDESRLLARWQSVVPVLVNKNRMPDGHSRHVSYLPLK